MEFEFSYFLSKRAIWRPTVQYGQYCAFLDQSDCSLDVSDKNKKKTRQNKNDNNINETKSNKSF